MAMSKKMMATTCLNVTYDMSLGMILNGAFSDWDGKKVRKNHLSVLHDSDNNVIMAHAATTPPYLSQGSVAFPGGKGFKGQAY